LKVKTLLTLLVTFALLTSSVIFVPFAFANSPIPGPDVLFVNYIDDEHDDCGPCGGVDGNGPTYSYPDDDNVYDQEVDIYKFDMGLKEIDGEWWYVIDVWTYAPFQDNFTDGAIDIGPSLFDIFIDNPGIETETSTDVYQWHHSSHPFGFKDTGWNRLIRVNAWNLYIYGTDGSEIYSTDNTDNPDVQILVEKNATVDGRDYGQLQIRIKVDAVNDSGEPLLGKTSDGIKAMLVAGFSNGSQPRVVDETLGNEEDDDGYPVGSYVYDVAIPKQDQTTDLDWHSSDYGLPMISANIDEIKTEDQISSLELKVSDLVDSQSPIETATAVSVPYAATVALTASIPEDGVAVIDSGYELVVDGNVVTATHGITYVGGPTDTATFTGVVDASLDTPVSSYVLLNYKVYSTDTASVIAEASDVYWQKLTATAFQVTPTPYVSTTINATLTITASIDEAGLPFAVKDPEGQVAYTGTFDITSGVGNVVISGLKLPETKTGTWTIDLPYGYEYPFVVHDYAVASISTVTITDMETATDMPKAGTHFDGQASIQVTPTVVPSATTVVVDMFVDDYTAPAASQTITATYAANATEQVVSFGFDITATPSTYVLVEVRDLADNVLAYSYYWVDAKIEVNPGTVSWTDDTIGQTITATALYPAGIPHDADTPIAGKDITFNLYNPDMSSVVASATSSTGTVSITATFTEQGDYTLKIDPYGAFAFITSKPVPVEDVNLTITATPLMQQPSAGDSVEFGVTIDDLSTTSDHYYRIASVIYEAYVDGSSDGELGTWEPILAPGQTTTSTVFKHTLAGTPSSSLTVEVDELNSNKTATAVLWAAYKVEVTPTLVYAGDTTIPSVTLTATIYDETGTVATATGLFVNVIDPTGSTVLTVYDNSALDTSSTTGVITFDYKFTQLGTYLVQGIYGATQAITATYKPNAPVSVEVDVPDLFERPEQGATITGVATVTVAATGYYTIYTVTKIVVVDGTDNVVEVTTATLAPQTSTLVYTTTFAVVVPVDTSSAKTVAVAIDVSGVRGEDYAWRAYGVSVTPTLVIAGIGADQVYTITGTVTDENGNPVAGAEVKLYRPTGDDYELVTSTVASDSGTFALTATFNIPGQWKVVDGFGASAVVEATAAAVSPTSALLDVPVFETKPATPFTVSGTLNLTFAATTAYTTFDVAVKLLVDGTEVTATEIKGTLNPSDSDITFTAPINLEGTVEPSTSIVVEAYSGSTLLVSKKLWANYTIQVEPVEVYAGLASVATYSITATVLDETGSVAADSDLFVKLYDPAGKLLSEIADNSASDTNTATGVIAFTLTATQIGTYKLEGKFGATAAITATYKEIAAEALTNDGPVYADGVPAGTFNATGVITYTVPADDYFTKLTVTIDLVVDGTTATTSVVTATFAPATASQTGSYEYALVTELASAPTSHVKSIATATPGITAVHIYWDNWTVEVTPTSVIADSNTVIYTFTGTVTSSSGDPVADATVTLVKPDGTIATSTKTDASGKFVLNTTIDQTGYWKVKTTFGEATIVAQYGDAFAQKIELLNPVRYETITSTPYPVTATVEVEITATDVYLKVPVYAYVLVDGATAAEDSVVLNFNPGQSSGYWNLNIPVEVLPATDVILLVKSGTASIQWYVYGYAPATVTDVALKDVPVWTATEAAPFDITYGAEFTITPTAVWTATNATFTLEVKGDAGVVTTSTNVLVSFAPDTATTLYTVTLTSTTVPTVYVMVTVQTGSLTQSAYVWKYYDIQLATTTFVGQVDATQTVSGTVTFDGSAAEGIELALFAPDGTQVATTTTASDGTFSFATVLDKLGTWTIKADYGNSTTFEVVRTDATLRYLEITSPELNKAPVSGQTIEYTLELGIEDSDAYAKTTVTVKYYVDDTLVGSKEITLDVDPHQTLVTATDTFTMPSDASVNVFITAEDGLYSDTTKPWANWTIELAQDTIEVSAATQTITGTVYNEYGNTSGVAGAEVALMKDTAVLATTTVQSDGTFAIDYILTEAGTYTVVTKYGASDTLTAEPKQADVESVEISSTRLDTATTGTLTVPFTATVQVPAEDISTYLDVVIELYSGTTAVATKTLHYEFEPSDTPTTVVISDEIAGTITDANLIKVAAKAATASDYFVVFAKLVVSNVPAEIFATTSATITGSVTYASDGSAVDTTDFAEDPMGIKVALVKDGATITTATITAGTFEFAGVDISQTGTYTIVPTLFTGGADVASFNVVYATAVGTQAIATVTPGHFYDKPSNATVTVGVSITATDVPYITATTVVVSIVEDGTVAATATAEVILPEHTTSTVVNVSIVVPEPETYAKVVVGDSEQLLWEKWVIELADLGTVKEGDVVTITGTLTKYDGTAVSDAAVELVKPDATVALSVTTDSLGRFTFADVTLDEVGTWTVRTKDDGTTFAATATFEVQPSEVLTTAESISIGDVTSYEKPTTGTVISVPITVQITATDIDSYVELEVKDIVDGATDSVVTASVIIPAGSTEATTSIDITIGADASQYVKVVVRDINGTATAEAYVWKAYTIEVSGYGLEDIESTITGTVTDYTGAPVAGETVKLFDTTDAEVASAVTGTDGTFSITFTPASGGTYKVRTTTYKAEADVVVYAYYDMKSSNGDDLQVAGTQHSYQKPEGTVTLCDLVTVTLGSAAEQPIYVRIRMRAKVDGSTAATTEYKVLFEAGQQVATMTMCTGEFDAGAANEEIKYYVYDVGSGEPNSGELHGYDYYWMKWILDVAQDTATIDETGTITGTLTDYNGDAIANVPVGLYNPADELVATVTTGSDGTFSFDGSLIDQAGTWTVKTIDDGTTFYAADTFEAVVVSGEITVGITLQPGWNVITIPVTTTKTLGELFPEASSIYRLEGTVFYYATNEVPKPGVAYWIKSKSDSAISVDITGTAINDTVEVTIQSAGWASIGNPFNSAYDMDNIVVIKGTETATGLQAAIDAGWISSIWFFNGSGWVPADPTAELEPTQAITFKVLVDEPLIFRWTP